MIPRPAHRRLRTATLSLVAALLALGLTGCSDPLPRDATQGAPPGTTGAPIGGTTPGGPTPVTPGTPTGDGGSMAPPLR